MITGHHDTFRLRHGPNVREYRDVEVTAVPEADEPTNPQNEAGHRDRPSDERYELTGTELVPAGMHIPAHEEAVTVGFFASHVLEGD